MKTKNQRTKDFAVMFCLLAALAGSGCAHVSGGTGIHVDSVAFIKPGATTKAEVIENLGQPTWEVASERVISYLWETTAGVNGDFFGRHCEFGADPTQHAFCIALDESNRVARAGFAKGRNFAELKKTIAAWSGSAPELLANGTGQPRALITAPAPLSGGRIALAYSGEVPQFDLQIADTKSEVAQDTARAAFFQIWGGLPIPPSPGEPEWPIVVSTFPFAALPGAIGGIHGAIAGVPAKKVDQALLVLTNAMADVRVEDALRSQLMFLLQQKNPGLAVFTNRFPAESEFRVPSIMDRYAPIPADLAMAPRQEGLCAELRRQGFDQVVLLRIINHGLSGLDGHNSNLSVNMAVRATLIHVADATQGESFYAQYSGAERKFTEWAANNGQFFQEEFERGLQSVVSQIALRLPTIPSVPIQLTDVAPAK